MNVPRRAASVLFVLCFALLSGCGSSALGSNHDRPRASATQASSASPSIRLSGRLLYTKTLDGDIQSIYTADADGQHERQLTEPGFVCCGTRVPRSSGRILVMPGGDPGQPVTGGTISGAGADYRRLLLTDPTLNLVPQASSPDGRRIAFEGWEDVSRSAPASTPHEPATAAASHA